MDKKIELTKIVLETEDGIIIELSFTQAKELYKQLHELFGPKFAFPYKEEPLIVGPYRDERYVIHEPLIPCEPPTWTETWTAPNAGNATSE
ncbi:hypothetical protein [Acinetobacter sp.]|uniref:hypothetical protein n=1 Tax=Acinetobacter sp. TaxID=472 RepID=UPI003D02067C